MCCEMVGLYRVRKFGRSVRWEGWVGEAPPEAPSGGEEAHEDEEMADLLDFLGGSGDTLMGERLTARVRLLMFSGTQWPQKHCY